MYIQPNRLLNSSSNPPSDLVPWLNYKNSLTDKLKSYSGEVALEVLQQSWTLPNWWDKFTLGLSIDAVMHREIVMYSRQIPCWYARTIIPIRTYQENGTFFDRLKHESLGNLIFNEPRVERSVMLNYAIDDRCLEYYWIPDCLVTKGHKYWLRLSVFTFADSSPFCLVEILLPGLLTVLKDGRKIGQHDSGTSPKINE